MNFTGSALPLLANAIEKFTLMQNSTEAVKKGGIVMAYVVQGPNPPIAIVQLFYNVRHARFSVDVTIDLPLNATYMYRA